MENNELQHHGTKGMKWGIRRFQYKNGSLTPEGRKRYNDQLNKHIAKAKQIQRARQLQAGKSALTSLKQKAKNEILNDKTKKALEDQKLQSKKLNISRLKKETRDEWADSRMRAKSERLDDKTKKALEDQQLQSKKLNISRLKQETRDEWADSRTQRIKDKLSAKEERLKEKLEIKEQKQNIRNMKRQLADKDSDSTQNKKVKDAKVSKDTNDSDSSSVKTKNIRKMSDAELTSRINRLRNEQQYRELTRSTGSKVVQEILTNSAKNIGTQFTTYAIGTGVNTLFKDVFDDESIVNPKKGQKDK